MILVRGVLDFILAQILSNIIGLTTISWLINQIITLEGDCSGGYLLSRDSDWFGAIGTGY